MYTKATIRKVLAPSTDALTVVQFCAIIDPENWTERAHKMENDEAKNLHSEWLAMAENELEKLLGQ